MGRCAWCVVVTVSTRKRPAAEVPAIPVLHDSLLESDNGGAWKDDGVRKSQVAEVAQREVLGGLLLQLGGQRE